MNIMFEDYIKNLPEKIQAEITSFKVESNKIIIAQDTLPTHVHLVKKGTMKAFHTNEKGQEFLFGIFGQDEWLGELEFFTKTKSMGTIETITDCELYRIPYEIFDAVLKINSLLMFEICNTLAERLAKLTERSVEVSYYPLEYLVAKYIVNQSSDSGNDIINVVKEDMAHYFGTNLRSINRILKKFADDGWITTNKNEIEILTKSKLKQVYRVQ